MRIRVVLEHNRTHDIFAVRQLKMSEQSYNVDQHFLQLIISLQAGAMQQMGKVASPFTGKVERNLEMARLTIDTLSMIEAKTKGNLSADEAKIIGHILYELRLNYVDEVKKEELGRSQTDTKDVTSAETEAADNVDSASQSTDANESDGTGPNNR